MAKRKSEPPLVFAVKMLIVSSGVFVTLVVFLLFIGWALEALALLSVATGLVAVTNIVFFIAYCKYSI